MSKKLKKIILVSIILIILVILEFIRSNTYIDIENINYTSSDIPVAFDGVRIVHISDYHNHGGSYDERLISKIKEAQPDYIFMTGDMADKLFTNTDIANEFMEKVAEIAPSYLVWGNHDKSLTNSEFEKMNNFVKEKGITVLDNQSVIIERNDEKILITGVYNYTEDIDGKELLQGDDIFSIWLNHFPENFENIADGSAKTGTQMDLLFTGHAHGGLIWLPFIKGLYAPGQGFFPDYTSGIYEYNGSSMIVSRGVGNSTFTRRFFDSFHLVVCELDREY